MAARLWANCVDGITTGSLTNVATTFSSAGLANLPVVAGGDWIYVTMDSLGAGGAPEIVQVTAHSASSTTATIVRGQLGTTARSHNAGVSWSASVYTVDLQRLDTIEANSWVTTARILDGAVTTNKLADKGVTAAKIADNTITAQQLANSSVGTSQLVDANVTTAKLVDSSVTTPKLAAASVDSTKLAASAVNEAALGSAAQTYSPVIDQAGTITRSIQLAEYSLVGGLCFVWVCVTLTAGGGSSGVSISITLPVAAVGYPTSAVIGSVEYFSGGGGNRLNGCLELNNSTKALFSVANSNGASLAGSTAGSNNNTAFIAQSGDIIRLFGCYRWA